MNALRLSLLEKETRGKKLVQFTHEPLRCLFSVSSFFFLKEKHTPCERWYLSFSSICPFFACFFLLLLFALFFYVIWELEKFKFTKM